MPKAIGKIHVTSKNTIISWPCYGNSLGKFFEEKLEDSRSAWLSGCFARSEN